MGKGNNQYLKNLDFVLARLGQSRVWLSEQAGLSRGAVGNLFLRNSLPSLDTAIDFARITGYPVEQMFSGDIEKYQPAGKSKRTLLEEKLMKSARTLSEEELEIFAHICERMIDFRRLKV